MHIHIQCTCITDTGVYEEAARMSAPGHRNLLGGGGGVKQRKLQECAYPGHRNLLGGSNSRSCKNVPTLVTETYWGGQIAEATRMCLPWPQKPIGGGGGGGSNSRSHKNVPTLITETYWGGQIAEAKRPVPWNVTSSDLLGLDIIGEISHSPITITIGVNWS